MTAGPAIVRHFSEDPSITEFVPHVAVTNPTPPRSSRGSRRRDSS
jgi:hypothetical protein